MQASRNINLCEEKEPICKLSRSKTPKTPITDMPEKNKWTFFCCTVRPSTLAKYIPLQKFSFLFRLTFLDLKLKTLGVVFKCEKKTPALAN